MKSLNFSQAFAKDEDSVKFLNDGTVKSKLATAKKLSEVNEKDYVAIFYVGGLGPVLDLASDTTNAKLASQVSTTKCMLSTVNIILPVLSSGENHSCCVPWTCVQPSPLVLGFLLIPAI